MIREKKIPMRRCVGCGERDEKSRLIRVVRTPGGGLILDAGGRANGRGAYLCKKEKCLARALRNRGIERALSVTLSDEMRGALEKEMQTIAESEGAGAP